MKLLCKTFTLNDDGYFQNMDDSKIFWKTMKPRFSNKCKTANAIIFTDGDMKRYEK